jgi:hypothetical protein
MRSADPWSLLALGLALCCSARPTAAEDPQRFELRTDRDHVVVVLSENGRATYTARRVRPDGSVWSFEASDSTWGWHSEDHLGSATGGSGSRRRALWVRASGVADGIAREFRFDFLYEPDRLTEFDKMGTHDVLRRVRDPSRAASSGAGSEPAPGGSRSP